jgi:hypothetical protein
MSSFIQLKDLSDIWSEIVTDWKEKDLNYFYGIPANADLDGEASYPMLVFQVPRLVDVPNQDSHNSYGSWAITVDVLDIVHSEITNEEFGEHVNRTNDMIRALVQRFRDNYRYDGAINSKTISFEITTQPSYTDLFQGATGGESPTAATAGWRCVFTIQDVAATQACIINDFFD